MASAAVVDRIGCPHFLGIKWGWQSLPNGGHEYIVGWRTPQLTDLQTFRKEGELERRASDIAQHAPEIRVVVGDEHTLPMLGNIPAAPATLPAGVSAGAADPECRGHCGEQFRENRRRTARLLRAAPISLTDSHQPAEGPSRPARRAAFPPLLLPNRWFRKWA